MIDLANDKRERAIAVGLVTRFVHRRQAEDYLDELALLADTAGADVIHKVLQERDAIDSATYIGKGKVEQLALLAEDESITLIIFDDDLSPVQLRNLERETKVKILDRSGLILDIFATRARTNEARTQVELAQLQYLLPRLTRQWTHLSKQFGGIGTKGPGETQIETDRRMIRQRIAHLKEKLERISSQRKTQRAGRKEFMSMALVGYTNVGKSTLLNSLASSEVFVENRLFATLDATTRMVELAPSANVLVTDTVGFIRKLPHHLVASFKSTLEEIVEADILLHVIDASHPAAAEQIQVVNATLAELGAAQKPVLHIFNKVDMLEDRSAMHEMLEKYSPAVFISAQRGINLSGLKEMLLSMLNSAAAELDVTLPASEYRILSQLHELAEISDKHYVDDVVTMKLRVHGKNRLRVEQLIGEATRK
ncbi:MAG TPA: GTPase HflX [Bacteroidota bacterium]|nr:GTPase HflX [Bacteroidota bacterium]